MTDHVVGCVCEIVPCETQNGVPGIDELVLSSAILDESSSGRMGAESVDLDDDSLFDEQNVGFCDQRTSMHDSGSCSPTGHVVLPQYHVSSPLGRVGRTRCHAGVEDPDLRRPSSSRAMQQVPGQHPTREDPSAPDPGQQGPGIVLGQGGEEVDGGAFPCRHRQTPCPFHLLTRQGSDPADQSAQGPAPGGDQDLHAPAVLRGHGTFPSVARLCVMMRRSERSGPASTGELRERETVQVSCEATADHGIGPGEVRRPRHHVRRPFFRSDGHRRQSTADHTMPMTDRQPMTDLSPGQAGGNGLGRGENTGLTTRDRWDL